MRLFFKKLSAFVTFWWLRRTKIACAQKDFWQTEIFLSIRSFPTRQAWCLAGLNQELTPLSWGKNGTATPSVPAACSRGVTLFGEKHEQLQDLVLPPGPPAQRSGLRHGGRPHPQPRGRRQGRAPARGRPPGGRPRGPGPRAHRVPRQRGGGDRHGRPVRGCAGDAAAHPCGSDGPLQGQRGGR